MRQRWEVDELIESWTLGPDDVELVANKTGPTRLGFGVLLKFFELEARFPRSLDRCGVALDHSRERQAPEPRCTCRSPATPANAQSPHQTAAPRNCSRAELVRHRCTATRPVRVVARP